MESLKKIKDKTVDLVVIDPPYEMNCNGSGGCFGRENREYHNEINPLTNGISNEVLNELVRVMKNVNIYIWCSKDQLRQYINYFENIGAKTDLLTWHKTNPVPTCNNKYLSDTEYILFFRKKANVYGSYKTKKKFYVTPTNKKDKKLYEHPTVKPLDIIENIITNSSLEGDVVLDCFMGSGTTGEACANTNRKFIGIELDENYFNIAKKRIDEAYK